MNTKLLMTLSALTMGVAGIILSFMPHEILRYVGSTTITILDPLVLQILGAVYFGFGMVNWTAKANLIGGIYGRPIAMGNFCHFAIGGLALIKGYFSKPEMTLLTLSIVYIGFGILFGVVLFRHPISDKKTG
jgi:hypothetical protein